MFAGLHVPEESAVEIKISQAEDPEEADIAALSNIAKKRSKSRSKSGATLGVTVEDTGAGDVSGDGPA